MQHNGNVVLNAAQRNATQRNATQRNVVIIAMQCRNHFWSLLVRPVAAHLPAGGVPLGLREEPRHPPR
eukprot:5325665-Pyramimonas_sp.AAC.1